MLTTAYLDDRALFQKIAAGDEEAFETLFFRYSPKLKPQITRLVKLPEAAEEILQDTFLKLWMTRTTLDQVQEPAAFLYRIASNLSLNQLRKQANHYKVVKELMHREGVNTNELLQHLDAKQLQKLIHEAVAALPEKRREVYLLTREEGLSHREISERLGISLNTVKQHVMAAVRDIQAHILNNTGIYIPVILLAHIATRSAAQLT